MRNGHSKQLFSGTILLRGHCSPFTKSSAQEQPVNRDMLEEIRRLEGVENRLAHRYGMASPQGNCIDPEAVLHEAKRRARLPLWHLLLSLWNGTSASETGDLEALNRLDQLRESILQQPVPSESPSSIQDVSVNP